MVSFYMSPATEFMVEEVLNVAQYDCNVIIRAKPASARKKVFDLFAAEQPAAFSALRQDQLRDDPGKSRRVGILRLREGFPSPARQRAAKEGYFEIANNGTLFLDEIGSLPLAMQSKPLRRSAREQFLSGRRNDTEECQRARHLREQYSAAKSWSTKASSERTCIIV